MNPETNHTEEVLTLSPEQFRTMIGRKLGEGVIAEVFESTENPSLVYKVSPSSTSSDNSEIESAKVLFHGEANRLRRLEGLSVEEGGIQIRTVNLEGSPIKIEDVMTESYALKLERLPKDSIHLRKYLKDKNYYHKLDIFKLIARFLKEMSQRGIATRDLKYQNFAVTEGADGKGSIIFYDLNIACDKNPDDGSVIHPYNNKPFHGSGPFIYPMILSYTQQNNDADLQIEKNAMWWGFLIMLFSKLFDYLPIPINGRIIKEADLENNTTMMTLWMTLSEISVHSDSITTNNFISEETAKVQSEHSKLFNKIKDSLIQLLSNPANFDITTVFE